MDYKKFQENLDKWKKIYKSLDEETRFVQKKKAASKEVEKAEAELGCILPEQLRNFFLDFSGYLYIFSNLPDELELPEGLEEVFSASFLISLDEVVNAETCRKDWADNCFSDVNNEYDRVWHGKLGIMTVANGDIIALDVEKENPPVVYLSHDDGEGHGAVLGTDFFSYLNAIAEVGFCGNEDWQMLPFMDDMTSGINPDCENAKNYRACVNEK